MADEMVEVTIKLTPFQYAVLAHRDADPREVIEAHQQGLANRYAQDLGSRIIDRERRQPQPRKLDMDNTKLINEILLADGYRNKAEREADIEAWRSKQEPTTDVAHPPHENVIA